MITAPQIFDMALGTSLFLPKHLFKHSMDSEREAASKAQDLFKQSLHKSTEILTSLYLPSASAHTLLLHADSIVKQQPHRSLPFYERAIKSLKGEWLVQVQARYVDACIASQEFYKAKTMVFK